MVSVDFVFGAFPGEALGREEGERKHVSCRPGKTDPGDHAFLIALRLCPSSAIGWGLLVAAACPPFLGKPGVNTCSSPREAWGPRGKLRTRDGKSIPHKPRCRSYTGRAQKRMSGRVGGVLVVVNQG